MNCCKYCGATLTDANWLKSRQLKNKKICKECENKQNNNRYYEKKEKYLISQKEKRQLIKLDVINYYGGKCELCGEKNIILLSLDHLDKNGRKHRKDILKYDSGTAFYKWVLNNKPNNLRLLCYNCNCQRLIIKSEDFGDKNIKRKNNRIDRKIIVFDNYGGKCVNCNIVIIDI